jgi:hypothetical protein
VGHRERALAELEDVSIQNIARRDPRGPLPRSEEDAYRRIFDHGLYKQFGSVGPSDALIVVEYQPRGTRPVSEVLSEDRTQCQRLGARARGAAESLDDPLTLKVEAARDRARESGSKNGNIS